MLSLFHPIATYSQSFAFGLRSQKCVGGEGHGHACILLSLPEPVGKKHRLVLLQSQAFRDAVHVAPEPLLPPLSERTKERRHISSVQNMLHLHYILICVCGCLRVRIRKRMYERRGDKKKSNMREFIHCMHTYIHTTIHTTIHTYHPSIPSIHTYHPSIHTYIQPYIHTYNHTYIHTTVHTYMHTYDKYMCRHISIVRVHQF